jgi:hypothetical protein
MAKNVPITARISKLLFGKNKVTQPIINVGKVEVSSPAKMGGFKSSNSPFKETDTGEDPKVTKGKSPSAKVWTSTSGTEGTPVIKTKAAGHQVTTYTPPTRTAAGDAAYENMTLPQREASDAKYIAKNTKTTGEPDTTIVTPAKPPTPGTLESAELYTREKGDAQTALDTRDVIRRGKVAARQTKRAEINVGKAEAEISGLKGKEKRKEVKRVKNTAKLNQATTNLAVAQGQSEGVKAQSAQNKKGTSTKDVEGEEKILTRANMSTTEQERLIKAEHAAKLAAGDSKTTKGAFDNTFKKEVAKESDKFSTEKKDIKSVAKKDNGFFAKKSPMKLKYFK